MNRRKHGVSFETAVLVFEDPGAVSYLDRFVEDEQRWHTPGLVNGTAILLVARTVKEQSDENHKETIRSISARKAVPHE